jgi:hypothetical protein
LDGPEPQWRNEDVTHEHDVPTEMNETALDVHETAEDLYDGISAIQNKLFSI